MNTNPTKIFSWKTAILLSLGAGLLMVCLSLLLQTRIVIVKAFSAEDPMPAAAAIVAPAGVGSSFEVPGKPARLIIPAIGVNAIIESVGLSWRGTGDMGVPTNFTNVAWYNGGPVPGEPGNAVIDGHLDGKSVPEAVFYNLGSLKPGDVVEVVDTGGKTLQFRVVDTKTYDYTASTTDIFSGDASKSRLNLITCAGDWIKSQGLYNKRVVVFTELVTT